MIQPAGIKRPLLRKWLYGLLWTGVALLLAAIIFPIFAQAKIGRGDSCPGQLKMMWTASTLYSEDSDGRFPLGDAWMDGLLAYMNGPFSERVFHDTRNATDPAYGYAFRESALHIGRSAIRNPAQFVLIFDSALDGRNRHSELWSLPQQGRHPLSATVKGADDVIFADGHVHQLSVWPVKPDSKTTPLQQALVADDMSQRLP